METKKILIVNTAGLGVGGITTHIINYIAELKKNNSTLYDITIVSSMIRNNRIIENLERLGCKAIFLPDRKNNLIRYRRELKKIMSTSTKFDVLHVHGNSPTMMIELELGKKYKIPVRIAHCHNSISNHPRLYKWMRPFFSRTYTTAVAASKKAGNWIFGENNFIVLNNAIFTKEYKFSNEIRRLYRNDLNIEDDEIAVGMIGNINEQKNPFFLEELARQMSKDNKNIKFLVVGDGPLRKKMQDRLNKQKNVKFLGLRSDVSNLLQAIDILIMPSLWEGLPLILIEAQTAGVRCIISDNISAESIINSKLVDRIPLDTILWLNKLRKKKDINRAKEYQVLENSRYNIKKSVETLRKLYDGK